MRVLVFILLICNCFSFACNNSSNDKGNKIIDVNEDFTKKENAKKSFDSIENFQNSANDNEKYVPLYPIKTSNENRKEQTTGGKPIKKHNIPATAINMNGLSPLNWDTNNNKVDSTPVSFKLFDYKESKEIRSGTVYERDSISVLIHSNNPAVRRYIYVVIFSTPAYKSSLVYPNEFSADETNLFPRTDLNGNLVMNFSPVNIVVTPPFGNDTYILLGTSEPIKDLSIFKDFNEVLLLLKGSKLSRFFDILHGNYYLSTLEVQARPLEEKPRTPEEIIRDKGLLKIISVEGIEKFNKIFPSIGYTSNIFSSNSYLKSILSEDSTKTTEDSTELFYTPVTIKKDSLLREYFPRVHIIQPEIESTRGGGVINTENNRKVLIKGIAVDQLNGIKNIKVNNDPPQSFSPVFGLFEYSYELKPGLNNVNVLIENNKGYKMNHRINFTYEPVVKKVTAVSRNYLLVIGIGQYQYWGKLNNAVKDAKDFRDLMQSRFGYQNENIVELYDPEATRDKILKTLKDFAARLLATDNLLIYYSGHGAYNKDIELGYWIPVDAQLNKESDYVENVLIARYLRGIKTKRTFLISDACYSGSLLDEGMRGQQPYIDKIRDFKARVVLASGRLEEVSDGVPGTNSPFAGQLLNFLRANNDKEILSGDIINFVKKAVGNNARQTPTGGVLKDTGDEGGEFIFERK